MPLPAVVQTEETGLDPLPQLVLAKPPAHSLEDFLLRRGVLPGEGLLRATNLAGYAFATLPPDHPSRLALRDAFLLQLSRHHRIKRELLPLLEAWQEQGIVVMVFKGFFMAEFVYPAAGARYHGDVDLIVLPEQAEHATRIALACGWTAYAGDTALSPNGHCAANLYAPEGAISLDLHRWAFSSQGRSTAVQRKVTSAMWSQSREVVWEGVRVRIPAPVDAILVGLVLQRCWSGDRWHLKPADAVDFQLLMRHGAVEKKDLLLRAEQLGCTRTLQIFLERCDPYEQSLDLTPPTRLQQLRWDAAVVTERPRGRWLARALKVPAAVRNVALVLPTLLRAHTEMSRMVDMRALLHELDPQCYFSRRGTAKQRWRRVQGIRWALRLFPETRHGSCVLRSLALFAALRRCGWPVVFVSGVRRDGERISGHAWVELDGRVLDELGESNNRNIYEVNFVYPTESSGRVC